MELVREQIIPYQWNALNDQVEGAEKPFTIALRIPDWCAGEYQLKGTEGAETWIENGYLYVKKAWSESDFVELDFLMKVRVYEADSRVREDAGKVAVMRGPIVYCLEKADNGKDLHLLSLDVNSEPEVAGVEIEGTVVKGITLSGLRQEPVYIKGTSLYRVAQEVKRNPALLRFIPYYTWANRGENEMAVWVLRV